MGAVVSLGQPSRYATIDSWRRTAKPASGPFTEVQPSVSGCTGQACIVLDRNPAWRPRFSQPRSSEQLRRLQHADDLERDRAVRRPAAARRLPAASDPLPASRAGADRRLCGDIAEPAPSVPEPGESKADLLGDYLRYVAAMPGPEDRGRLGPRRPARAGRAVRRSHGDHPPEARLRRPYHQRLPARPRRGACARLSAFRLEPVRQPCLRPAGRFRIAGQDRRASRSTPAT